MPKKSKEERITEKVISKHAHIARDRFKGEPAMYCTAVSGRKIVSTLTGVGKSKTNYILLLAEYKDFLPWKDKVEKITRTFDACSEAKVWLDIKSQGYEPKNFSIKAHNRFFKDAPPCENCKEWVGDAFKTVKKENLVYRNSSRQFPH